MISAKKNCPSSFYVLGSSSSGNCYIFNLSGSKIMVEAGFKPAEIVRRAVLSGTDTTDLMAILITHEHSDHALGVMGENNYFSKLGIPIYASEPTLKKLGEPSTGIAMHSGLPLFVSPNVLVMPFKVNHDAAEPLGYMILDRTADKRILFINDCSNLEFDIGKTIPFDMVFIECNYYDQALHIEMNKAEKEGNSALIKRYKRIHDCHLGLSGTLKILQSLDLSNCKAIFLMHLSDQNSRETKMVKAVEDAFPGINVFACRKEGGFEKCRS